MSHAPPGAPAPGLKSDALVVSGVGGTASPSFFPGLHFLFSFTVVQLTSEVNSTPSIISYFVAHCVIVPARGQSLLLVAMIAAPAPKMIIQKRAHLTLSQFQGHPYCG